MVFRPSEMVTNGPKWCQGGGQNDYVFHSKSTCGHFVIFASKNIAKTTVFYTTFRHVAISSFLLPKNIEFSLRFPLQIDMCKIGNFTFPKRWNSLGKSHTFGKQKWPSGTMSSRTTNRKLNSMFFGPKVTKSQKRSNCVRSLAFSPLRHRWCE